MTVIEVKNVTKKYKIYHKPKDALLEMITGKKRHQVKVAIDNVSFSVEKGETFGVLGGNGSGKSTILSMINGTTFPTSGKIITRGEVSLLNVSAGIIKGYTGLENIYYKCGIMGLTKSQIEAKLDDIIEFSEIGDYLDQPVKKYSSGMKSKLGFSIAIHIEPDILIVDEALAVGDKRFQDKCHARIAQLREGGMTLLYVSHSKGTIVEICERACWIQKGELICLGNALVVSELYDQYMSKLKTIDEIKAELEAGVHELS